MTRPRLKLSDGLYIELIGGALPYLWIGNELHVVSGPVFSTKKNQKCLETFLRRSLEIVSGKRVVLKEKC